MAANNLKPLTMKSLEDMDDPALITQLGELVKDKFVLGSGCEQQAADGSVRQDEGSSEDEDSDQSNDSSSDSDLDEPAELMYPNEGRWQDECKKLGMMQWISEFIDSYYEQVVQKHKSAFCPLDCFETLARTIKVLLKDPLLWGQVDHRINTLSRQVPTMHDFRWHNDKLEEWSGQGPVIKDSFHPCHFCRKGFKSGLELDEHAKEVHIRTMGGFPWKLPMAADFEVPRPCHYAGVDPSSLCQHQKRDHEPKQAVLGNTSHVGRKPKNMEADSGPSGEGGEVTATKRKKVSCTAVNLDEA